MTKYQNTDRIIQWNSHGYKSNYNELHLLIAELNPTTICLQETFKKLTNQIQKPLNNMTTYDTRQELQLEYQSLLGKISPKIKSTSIPT